MTRILIFFCAFIMLLSLLAACVNDTGIQTDTGLPQQSQPTSPPTGWPEGYSTILQEYKTLADNVYRDIDAIIDNVEWQKQNIPYLYEIGLFWEPGIWGINTWDEKDDYGYALKDLNGDGSDELMLLLKDYSVLAIFSTADGKPKLVDRFWDRYYCYAIDKSDLLYIFCYYDSSEDWYYTIERLSDDGSELLPIERYGMESFDYDTGGHYPESHYYKVIDEKSYNEREIITEAEFDKLYDGWESTMETADNSGITFIPILD